MLGTGGDEPTRMAGVGAETGAGATTMRFIGGMKTNVVLEIGERSRRLGVAPLRAMSRSLNVNRRG